MTDRSFTPGDLAAENKAANIEALKTAQEIVDGDRVDIHVREVRLARALLRFEHMNALYRDLLKSKTLPSETAQWIPVADGQLPRDEGLDVLTWTITGRCLPAHPLRIRVLHAEAQKTGEDCFYQYWQPMPKGPSHVAR